MRIKAAFSLLCFLGAGAVCEAQSPLSAIDWLDDPAPVIGPVGPRGLPDEEPAARQATVPDVEVSAIAENEGQEAVGLLAASATGLPDTIWSASDFDELARAIGMADFHRVPALQELLYTLMLAEAKPPFGADAEAFLTLRARKLAEFGAVEAAEAMVERVPMTSTAHFSLWFDLTLLAGLEDKACNALAKVRALSDDYAAQSFCAMRRGDWNEAALILDTADALNLMSRSTQRLLSAFLDPELASDGIGLAPPRDLTPLEFRLYESIGRPLPTASLPLSFAVADLRDLAGWKAQLEAAERLVRVQAYPPNALLGLYTTRKPAASGGVWDRARAVQRLEAALEAGEAERLSEALISARRALRAIGLETALAEIYSSELALAELTPAGQMARFELTLLSKGYEGAEAPADKGGFLAKLAQGVPEGAQAGDDLLAMALQDGFLTSDPSYRVNELMAASKLGEAILEAAQEMARGLDGDYAALRAGVAGLRQMGLEAVTRRSALQMMLLRRES